MRFIYNAVRMSSPEEIREFAPELVINCVSLNYTIDAFKAVLPYLQPYCIISDIASVKTGLQEFYQTCGFLMYLHTPCLDRLLQIWEI